MDRHQGEVMPTLTDLHSKHRAGGETEPRKDYLMSSVTRNIPHQESSQLPQAPTIILDSYVQDKVGASSSTSLLKSLLCKMLCFCTL